MFRQLFFNFFFLMKKVREIHCGMKFFAILVQSLLSSTAGGGFLPRGVAIAKKVAVCVKECPSSAVYYSVGFQMRSEKKKSAKRLHIQNFLLPL